MLDEMIWLGVWQDNDMYSVSSRLEGVRTLRRGPVLEHR